MKGFEPLTPLKKVGFWTILAASTLLGLVLVGETLVWTIQPTQYLYPRYQASPEYGLIPFPEVVMVHGYPREYKFHYTTDANSCRASCGISAIDDFGLPTIVVLGDSYSFGIGVADGDEYPAVMKRALAGKAEVLNLGSPGWGLTQEIRRYAGSGEIFDPQVVILQFCANDIMDNLVYPVAHVNGDGFEFVPSTNSLTWTKRYLSRSWIQRSQLYNFLRSRAFRMMSDHIAAGETARLEDSGSAAEDSSTEREAAQQVHVDLMEAFAGQLKSDGRHLILISVDRQLDQFPLVRQSVEDLRAHGALRYVEVEDWLDGMPFHASPEGHLWGTNAHHAIGDSLALLVMELMSYSTDTSSVDERRSAE